MSVTEEVRTAPRTGSGYFWRFWTALTLSRFGTAVSGVALPLVAVLVLDASPLELGIVTAASNVAWLVLGLPAGVITQRLSLRATQVGADLVRCAAIASVPLAWGLGHLTLVHLVVVGLVISFADVLFDVANATFLPSIVDRAELQRRNSVLSGTDAVTTLSGPSLAGVVIAAVGSVLALLVDVVSYLASAVLLRSLPDRRAERRDDWPPMRAMIAEGWRYVTRHPVMAPAMWAATAANLVAGAHLALLPLYLVRGLHAPVALIGVLLAVDGVGALVGSVVATPLSRKVGTARACLVAAVVATAGAVLIPLGHGWAGIGTFAVGILLFAVGTVVISINARTHRQTVAPEHLLSRVMATVRFVSWGALPIGGLLAGALAEWADPRAALLAFGVTAAAVPLVLAGSRIRKLRDLDD